MRYACALRAMTISAMLAAAGTPALAGQTAPFDKVTDGLTKVISTADGSASYYDLYADKDTGRLLAALPHGYESSMVMISCTVSGGDPEAGVMGPTHYAMWQKRGEVLALIAPNFTVRTDGDQQAKDSVEQLYTGRVLLATPIISETPDGRPVIDLQQVTLGNVGKLFGASVYGEYGPNMSGVNAQLAELTKAKAFPENVIVQYEAPRGDGVLVKLTYDFSTLEGTPGYKPRTADPRVGYFYDYHQDFAKPKADEVTERYINRWNLEKADGSLQLSPPKQPVVWYVEHTVPVRYRRYVRDGILMWNKAFEAIGIAGALEVRQQDASSGAYMDIDPEDARYNFFRWNTTNEGYAIGPSRTNPMTGEILDADVVWHQGLTRALENGLSMFAESVVENTFDPETTAWIEDHPEWDPRVRLAQPAEREQVTRRIAIGNAAAAELELGTPEHPWTHQASNLTGRACRIGNMLAADFSLADMAMATGLLDGGAAYDGELIDGVPEAFIGQMIRYISAHEVGHCLGLQHNMAASTIHSLEEINSPGFKGPLIGSVMDYAAANLNHELGEVQGPYATTEVGPYDMWAIAYGYGPASSTDDVLEKVSEPDNIFVSQVAMSVGSDPRNMTWDLGSDNLTFAESRLSLVKVMRAKLLDDVVDKGDSWAEARRRYQSLLNTQAQCLNIASNWIGGSFTNNDFKGDPGDRSPIEDVPAESQRRAFNLICNNSFEDDAFGLSPDLVRHFGKSYFWDPDGMNELLADPSYPVHDQVGAVQAFALTMLMNPGTLRRVYDNEYRTQDANPFTVAELMTDLTDRVWRECQVDEDAENTDAVTISSMRRNLQREHVERLITLALLDKTTSPALRTISTLAKSELRRIGEDVSEAAQQAENPYDKAHLADISVRIVRAMDAAYVLDR